MHWNELLLALLLLAAPLPAQTNHAHMLAGVNAQTGVAYTFIAKDVTLLVTFNNAGAVTATMPDATTAGFGAGSIFTVKNLGTGNVTISAPTSTFDGQASLLLITGQGVDIYSDGQNFFTGANGSSSSGGGSACGPNSLCKGTGVGLPVVNSTISDDSVNPPRSLHGLDTVTSGISYEPQNNTSTGTALNLLACNDGTGKAITCSASVTHGIIGITQGGAGTSGNAIICKLITCSVIFDNTAVVNDYAISSSTAGELHDTGSTSPTPGNINFLVISANAGTGTAGNVVPPGDLTGGSGTGFVNPMTTLGDTIYGGAAGAPTRLPGATTLNGVFQQYGSVAAGGVATAPILAPSGVVPRFVSTSSDTVLFTDRGKFLDYITPSGSDVPVTLPQAGSTGFADNFYFCTENDPNGDGGDIVFTPTVSTVNGNASYTLAIGSSACFISDNANYTTKDQSSTALPGGDPGQIQYNSSGAAFGGAAFVYSIGAGFGTLGTDPTGSGQDSLALFMKNVAGTNTLFFGENGGNLAVEFADTGTGYETVNNGANGWQYQNTAAGTGQTLETDGWGAHVMQQSADNAAYTALFHRFTDTSPTNHPAWVIENHANTAIVAQADYLGGVTATDFIAGGTTFTISGCSTSSLVGGATAGQFVSGTTGTCAVTITLGGAIAPTQWACFENDITTPADKQNQQTGSTTTAAFTGTTVSGDVMRFACTAF